MKLSSIFFATVVAAEKERKKKPAWNVENRKDTKYENSKLLKLKSIQSLESFEDKKFTIFYSRKIPIIF